MAVTFSHCRTLKASACRKEVVALSSIVQDNVLIPDISE